MGAPQARLYELAKRLIGMGHKVTVLTAMPNYPTGRVFSDYRWRVRAGENIDGIKVVRTCLYASKSSRTLPRLLSYLSFGFSCVLLGIWGLGRQDVVLIESPPLFLVPLALLVSKIVRGRSVMMVSDIWPDIIIRMGRASEKSLSVKAMLWLEKYSYNHSYAVALTNSGASAQIRQRFSHLKNITVISNGVDTAMFRPDLRSEKIRADFGTRPDDFLVGYCGLHGLAQGLEVVLDAAKRLQDKAHIKLIMIGDGPTKERLVKKAEQMKLSNLSFYDRHPKKQMPAILASLDVSLVTLAGRFPGTMPSKVYEALASGTVPIVARACEADALVTQYNAGRCYEPLNGEELADAIFEFAENKDLLIGVRNNCLELSRRFDRDIIAKRTEKILTSIAEEQSLPEVNW